MWLLCFHLAGLHVSLHPNVSLAGVLPSCLCIYLHTSAIQEAGRIRLRSLNSAWELIATAQGA